MHSRPAWTACTAVTSYMLTYLIFSGVPRLNPRVPQRIATPLHGWWRGLAVIGGDSTACCPSRPASWSARRRRWSAERRSAAAFRRGSRHHWSRCGWRAARTPSARRGSTCTSPRGCRTGCRSTSAQAPSPPISPRHLRSPHSSIIYIE